MILVRKTFWKIKIIIRFLLFLLLLLILLLLFMYLLLLDYTISLCLFHKMAAEQRLTLRSHNLKHVYMDKMVKTNYREVRTNSY
jgi:sensor domain CHASE-containing protein